MACVLKKCSDERNRAPEMADELIRYGEPVYYAHKIPIEVISHTLDTEAVISKLVEKTG